MRFSKTYHAGRQIELICWQDWTFRSPDTSLWLLNVGYRLSVIALNKAHLINRIALYTTHSVGKL